MDEDVDPLIADGDRFNLVNEFPHCIRRHVAANIRSGAGSEYDQRAFPIVLDCLVTSFSLVQIHRIPSRWSDNSQYTTPRFTHHESGGVVAPGLSLHRLA